MPDFLVHNSDTSDFTVAYLDDMSLAGIYNIEITSTIQFPTSATDPTLLYVSESTDFEVILIDPCNESQILNWDIGAIEAELDGDTVIIEIPEALD